MVEQRPAGPAPLDTGDTQPVPLHWYQMLSEAACTQVRGATGAPRVADWHHAKRAVHPVCPAIQPSLEHLYQAASLADCTQVPRPTSLASVAE